MTTEPSCVDCPSYIPETQTTTGAPICHRYGYLLGRPGMGVETQVKIQRFYAGPDSPTAARLASINETRCLGFGAPRVGQSRKLQAQVSAGNPDMIALNVTRDPDSPPLTCTGCANFIPAQVVRRELGWAMGMCGARGRLMPAADFIREASVCDISRSGTAADTTDGVVLLHQYEDVPVTLAGNVGAPRVLAGTAHHRVDPRDYVTDKPVSQKAQDAGIRAWRKVEDPAGKKSPVFLPIYDGVKLCGFDPRIGDMRLARDGGTGMEGYGNYRPDLYVDHQNIMYDLCVEMFCSDEVPVLQGGSGVGKTQIGAWFAWLMDLPYVRIGISKGIEEWMLKGQGELVIDEATGNNVTAFKPGRFTKVYGLPCVIMVDEPNLKAEIFEFLRPANDGAGQIVIDEAGGLIVPRGRSTYLMYSMNPSWDPLYVGTEPLSAAETSRLSMIWIDLPAPDVERAIIASHCADRGYNIPRDTLDKIMAIASDLRALIEDDVLTIAWGLREQIKVAKKTEYYDIEKAFARAVTDGLEPAIRTLVLASVSSHA